MSELHLAFHKLLNMALSYPPSLSVFLDLLKYCEIDFDEAFERFLLFKPEGKAETYVSQYHGYDLRRMARIQSRKEHERLLKRSIDRRRLQRAEVQPPIQLSKCTPISLVDTIRERAIVEGLDAPESFPAGSVFERVASRWGSKKQSFSMSDDR